MKIFRTAKKTNASEENPPVQLRAARLNIKF